MKKLLLVVLSVVVVLSMSTVAFSADDGSFISSAELQEAPELLPVEEENVDIVAVIDHANDDQTDVDRKYVTIVSLSEAFGKDDSSSKALIAAYNEVKGYTDLVSDINGMEDVLKEMGYKSCNASVSAMFELHLDETHNAMLSEDGATVTVRFSNTIKAVQGELVVAHMVDGEWVLVDPDLVTVDAESINAQFDSLCPVMFITVDGELAPANNTLAIVLVVIACVVVAAAAAVVVFIILKKKKADENS